MAAINRAEVEMGLPANITGKFAGTAQAYQEALANQPVLIGTALLAVYIVLGILYESLIHPLTIISTLPSAGVGALMAMVLFKSNLDLIGMIGIILLIGIVKKNAIMMIDFALAAERNEGMSSRDAIYQACLLRFRPIMMTTMCALLGGMPMALGWGAGAELRKPLGIAIVGGLLVSQMLTLFTTPVIYLYLDRLRKRFDAGSRITAPSRFSGSRRARGEWRLMTASIDDTAGESLFLGSVLLLVHVRPEYQRPVAQTPPALKAMAGNDQWKMATPSDDLLKGNWWEIFGDPQLNQLEELVSINNQNVKQAEAQFRAGARTGSGQSCQLLSLHRIESVHHAKRHGRTVASEATSQTFSLGATATWEPDLWGRVRLSVENAVDNAQVSAADLENVRLSAAVAARNRLLFAGRRGHAAASCRTRSTPTSGTCS